MKRFNYHSHSTFCDGKSSLEDMVLAAINKGMDYFGFSAHAPVPFNDNFALQKEDVNKYLAETERLKEKYKDRIRLFTSMEFDYITDIMEDINEQAKTYGLDYIIASVHMVREKSSKSMWFIDGSKQEIYDKQLKEVFDGDIRRGVETFYDQTIRMISNVRPDIVGHLDKIKMHNKDRYFRQTESWYRDLVMETLYAIKENDCICELNTRGLYKGRSDDFFPSTQWIKAAAEVNLKMTISTDCHNATEVDLLFDEAIERLKESGHKYVWYFDGQWKAEKLT